LVDLKKAHALPDSKGSIRKILFHQSSVFQNDRQISKGIFQNFLKNLNRIGMKPKIYVFATYRNDSERVFLEEEANQWKPLVQSLDHFGTRVSNQIWSRLAYAQDTCLIANSTKPVAIMTRSDRNKDMVHLLSKSSLLKRAGFQIVEPEGNFTLEGGHVFASSKVLLYSNPKDQEILSSFEQKTDIC